MQTEAYPTKSEKIALAIASVEQIGEQCKAFDSSFAAQLTAVHAQYRESARNLLHYLAPREGDMRDIQEVVAALGLSSLDRAERNMMASIQLVRSAMAAMVGENDKEGSQRQRGIRPALPDCDGPGRPDDPLLLKTQRIPDCPADTSSLKRNKNEIRGRTGLGRVQLAEWLLDNDDTAWPSFLSGGWHHMGTTRMHADPRKGVVDSECQVHGVGNLYVAGSGVFSTSGAPNPTLTLVALTLRLSDNLKQKSM